MFDWFKRSRREAPEVETSGSKFEKHIDAYLEEIVSLTSGELKPGLTATGKEILSLEPADQIKMLHSLLDYYIAHFKAKRGSSLGMSHNMDELKGLQGIQDIMSQMFRRNLPYSESDLESFLRTANKAWNVFAWYRPHKVILGVIKRIYSGQEIPGSIIPHIKKVRKLCSSFFHEYAEDRDLKKQVGELLGELDLTALVPDFNWSKSILADISNSPEDEIHYWNDIIAHASSANNSKPSKKWNATAGDLIDKLGAETIAESFHQWVNYIQSEKYTDNPFGNTENATAVKGLVWIAGLIHQDSISRDIKQLANYCFRKIPGVGAVSVKVGNACLYELGQSPGLTGIALLSELLQNIKYPSAKKIIEKELDATAKRRGITRNDLQELSAPDFGLDDSGRVVTQLENYEAQLSIGKEKAVNLVWQNAQTGKTQKSVPSSIKTLHASEIKALKRLSKDINTALQSHSHRIENLYLKKASWSFADWQTRYIGHPLLRQLGRKLIWQFETGVEAQISIWLDGHLVDSSGKEIRSLDSETRVKLWHPVDSNAEEVLAWRRFLHNHEITQPFKQAHREVYLLTDAERQTEQYSNRFAAHILKQHQMNALCQQRGWQYYLQGGFDSHNTPQLDLPDWGMQVEFWVDGIESSINDMGIFNYISSDQVRFTNGPELVTLSDVNPLVFSEAMRHVDLFIGVCSIGNDPAWRDGGYERYNDYWRSYSFGELDTSAVTRKEVLGYLLPKLKIADQCKIADRYLIVEGSIRTYKIHLGSGNILMEPNNQYLCIVEGRSRNNREIDNLFLPFEGDHRMAVILSKAFMLADDKKLLTKLF